MFGGGIKTLFHICYRATTEWHEWWRANPDVAISSERCYWTNTRSANKHKIRANRPLIRFPLKMKTLSVRQWVQLAHSQYLHLWIEFGGRRAAEKPVVHRRPTVTCLTCDWKHTDAGGRHVWQHMCVVRRHAGRNVGVAQSFLWIFSLFISFFANIKLKTAEH